MSELTPGRANVVGVGLIGGSIGLALRHNGWHVTGCDLDSDTMITALEIGAIDKAVGPGDFGGEADITFVATAVGELVSAVKFALNATTGVVTDVGGVKAPIVSALEDDDESKSDFGVEREREPVANRFIGGHPMAGNEQEGVEGSQPDMFYDAIWVLTPTFATDPATTDYARAVITSLGAQVITLSPWRHDELVALVSHVPHLTAATLMCLADEKAEQRRELQRLAAGGFRDMTRIAAGHPGIWPDICLANKTAICDGLDRLIAALTDMRNAVHSDDRATLLSYLRQAREARLNLPSTVPSTQDLRELRVVIADQPGEIARLTMVAAQLEANIYDLEIAHSPLGERGVMVMMLAVDDATRLAEHLADDGYTVTLRRVK